MVAQKQKNCWQKFSVFLNDYKNKNQLIKTLNSFYLLRSYERLSQNQKTGDFRELFLSQNDFKTCCTVNLSRKHPDFGDVETNQRYKIQTFIFLSHALLHMNSV